MINKSDNVLMLLTTKTKLIYLTSDMSVRQALEKMRVHRFTAIPIIDEQKGTYVGSLAEGDLLYNLIREENVSVKELEDRPVMELVREKFMPAMKVSTSMEELFELITIQNYVPIVDDRNILMGIVTRRSAMRYLISKINE